MKLRVFLAVVILLSGSIGVFAQQKDSSRILETIVKNYYKNEKVVVKGRQQLLFFYCEKANNNEEIFEAVQGLKLATSEVKRIRTAVNSDTQPANWQVELEALYQDDQTKIQQKINDCLSVEQYQEKRAKLNLNNQRLMIVSKPVLFENNTKALVKVTFYRTIEHNNGSVLLMQKTDSGWIIKDFLNSWST
ncbi:hypothetical protein HUK80_08765 [Flavobacterium sp. MAH-1]|uniref:Lumazine-binding n=1 Tax=Flavobacterium agri TaxID=2743471 RepID=A0A7Y8Y1Y7_9FLAO|nr:hypothetical protein [Flavobacterium agri]NUY80983.1 hypothetical protein [Flavobacterium agri]NYA71007.1 hypothetical protein [Flavobacterium agri]